MSSYDPASLIVAAVAAALIVLAWRLAAARPRAALAAIALAGCVLRLDAAWQHSLHRWDERFHALVARNLMTDPLRPVLYRDPALDYDYRDWTSNHVWLHKPPLALWLMAGSMRLFGVDEVAMRLPSVLLSTAAIVLTFLIGRALVDWRVGLLAATFHACNGFLVALASGRRVAEHVDTALVLCVELSVWLALGAARSWTRVVLSGAAIGLGLLSKSVPALLALPIVFALWWLEVPWRDALRRTAAAALTAMAVAAPWTIYSWQQWPAEARWETVQTLLHVSRVVDADSAGPLAYVRDLPRFFGELVPLSLVLLCWWMARRRAPRALDPVALWIALPYALFTIAATRMPAFVMVSAPAMFVAHAYAWWRLRAALPDQLGWRRAGLAVLLGLMAATPARYLLEPTSVLERRDRRPPATGELRVLEERVGPGNVVIFNLPLPIEAMFYTPYTVYAEMPTGEQLRRLTASGRRVVIYRSRGESPAVPADWPVSYVDGDIRTPGF